jgi:formylglycine-generating enzyme required for sulfatase activity
MIRKRIAMIGNEESFIAIPRGRYLVGLSREQVDRLWDGERNPGVKKEFVYASCPVHVEEVGEVLVCGRLVSRAQFMRFVSATGYRTEAESDGWGWVSIEGRWRKRDGVSWRRPFGGPADERYASHPDVPVMQVSWNDADAYCRWLGSEHGERVRLPRETEWEIFARVAGVPGFGTLPGETGQIRDSEAFCEAVIRAADLEIAPPGLLWEWTEDWYERYPGGDGHRDFGTVYRVLRGGSVLSVPVQRSLEFRLRKCPTARSPYYGFRVAVER